MTAASIKRIEIDEPQSVPAPKPRRWKRILLGLVAILFAAVLALGLWPAKADFAGDEATAGVGLDGGGLKRSFPSMIFPADNSPAGSQASERIELGRLLYFDPILSGANDISCATCHHPDLGLSDGRALSMGKGGRGLGPDRAGAAEIKRAAPTVWNAAFNHMQFWDGRAPNLEEQARGPITSDIEMAENPETLVSELKAIPEYSSRFDAAFASGVTFDNVVKAIAAFERTLTTNNSPFDRFVAGDQHALTDSQRRGFDLFRSGKSRCFECHGLPTFANRDFKIIGVPDTDSNKPDFGRFEVTQGEGNKRAFKVPTLRNVALTAPYMHNGRFKTLEEVIDFYAGGGGPGKGFDTPHINDKIRVFPVTSEERADLAAFLISLTDESNLPQIPDRVPSGLAVVPRLTNPGREIAAKFNTGSPREQAESRAPQTITVKTGESIQSAVRRARAGDTIEVMPGVYHEMITIDIDNITLKGVTGTAQPARPVLDGKGQLSDAVIVTGNNFQIEGFDVRDYTANGIVVQNAHAPVFRDLVIDKTGLYGVYPVSCTSVWVERVTASGIADAAIYVGQSRDIVVKDCIAHDNVTGIEIENSVNAVVENNYVYNNTGGILVFVLPNNPSKVGRNCKVINNRVINNNHPNFGAPNSIVSRVPPGTGVMIMAADETEVTGNEIRGNDCYGVAIFSLDLAFPPGTSFDVGPTPENNWIHDNVYSDNGRNPAGALARAGLKGADLLWDLSGSTNRWQEASATQATPLLSASWPAAARRAQWRFLQFAKDYL